MVVGSAAMLLAAAASISRRPKGLEISKGNQGFQFSFAEAGRMNAQVLGCKEPHRNMSASQ